MAGARARRFKGMEDLLSKHYPLFEKLAAKWRDKNPAEALLSVAPMRFATASAQSELDAAIREAGKQLQAAMDAKRADRQVLIGRSPHVLSMLGGVLPNLLPMVIEPWLLNKTVAPAGSVNVPPGSNNHFGDLAGVTGEDLARAIYRPAAVVEDLSQAGNYTLFTNILTAKGPLVVFVETAAKADIKGRSVPVVLVKSTYARDSLADWINGKDPKRVVHYIDQNQIGEAVTGRLNPANQNPAFTGRDLVSAKGALNASGRNALSAPSPISDISRVAAFGSPASGNYRGFATVKAGLDSLLAGKGCWRRPKTDPPTAIVPIQI